ncbi:hypothetical protein NUW58_g4097 [Xylaria curta]|uniref:Uncharacterized protein n=1 Tax=Xylaria curta TaxID=42375 RepID=A0ACC1PAY5_9PEZI|nr:hypothetical protein NUW58_g4097 [Xylaria curta]
MDFMFADDLSFLDREISPEEESSVAISGKDFGPIRLPSTDPNMSVREALRHTKKTGLCEICRDALQCLWRVLAEIRKESPDYDFSEPPELPRVVYHHRLHMLKELGKHCCLCRLVFKNLPRSCQFISEGDEEQSQNYRLGLRDNGEFLDPKVFKNGLTEGMIDVLLVNYAAAETGGLATYDLLSTWLIPESRYPGSRYFGATNYPSTLDDSTSGSAAARALAINWLNVCKASSDGYHSECGRKDKDYMPTRLLDVRHATETGYLTLVDTEEVPDSRADKEYITLSHCWGESGNKTNPLLRVANLGPRKTDGLELKDLPQTFQDAVTVATWFDIRWLWIDCLCIIQDSLGGEDWSREADLMDKTYRNAVLNISADVGPQISLGNPATGEPYKKWIITENSLFDGLCRSPSFSRAWIHRERQLSSRILHFDRTGMLWECCANNQFASHFANEEFPNGMPEFAQDSEPDWKLGTIDTTEPTHVYHTWYQICRQFSQKNLTYPSDMPVILSSLAEEYSQILPSSDSYISGHWRSQLPYDLAWHTRIKPTPPTKQTASPTEQTTSPPKSTIPSWSWFSCGNGKECFWLPRSENDCTSLVDVVDVVDDSMRLDTVKPSDLAGRSILDNIVQEDSNQINHVQPRAGAIGDMGSASKVRISPPREDGNHLKSLKSSRVEVWLDERRDPEELVCFALLLYRKLEAKGKATYAYLLLKQEEDPETYTRIGTMLLGDESALMLQYTWGCPIEKEIWKSLSERLAEEREAMKGKAEKRRDDNPLPPAKDDVGDDTKRRRLNCLPTQDSTVEQHLYDYHTTVESFFSSQGISPCLTKVKPRMFKIE